LKLHTILPAYKFAGSLKFSAPDSQPKGSKSIVDNPDEAMFFWKELSGWLSLIPWVLS
jgi:hypothetical protein